MRGWRGRAWDEAWKDGRNEQMSSREAKWGSWGNKNYDTRGLFLERRGMEETVGRKSGGMGQRGRSQETDWMEEGDTVFWLQEVEKKPPRWVSIDRMVKVYKAKGEREGTTEGCRWDKSIRVRGEHLDRQMRPDYIAVKENKTDIQTGRLTERGWVRTSQNCKLKWIFSTINRDETNKKSNCDQFDLSRGGPALGSFGLNQTIGPAVQTKCDSTTGN